MSQRIGASVIALYDKDRKVLLQHRDVNAKTLPNHWAFFGGGVEAGEDARTAITRELKEELEYDVRDPYLLHTKNITWQGAEMPMYIFVEPFDESQNLVQHEGQGMGWWNRGDVGSLLVVEHDREALEVIFNYLETLELD